MPKAKEIIEKNYLYIENNKKHYNFSEYEIKNAYENAKEWMSNNDILWNMFNSKNVELIGKKDWGLYRNNLHNMGNLLFEENKFEQALTLFIGVVCADLTGMENGNLVSGLDSIFVAPGMIKMIKSTMGAGDIDENEFSKYIELAKPYYTNVPFSYYSSDSMQKIILDCLHGKKYDYSNYPIDSKPKTNSTEYSYYDFFNNEIKDYNQETDGTNHSNLKKNNQIKKSVGCLTTLLLFLFLILIIAIVII